MLKCTVKLRCGLFGGADGWRRGASMLDEVRVLVCLFGFANDRFIVCYIGYVSQS